MGSFNVSRMRAMSHAGDEKAKNHVDPSMSPLAREEPGGDADPT